MKAALSYIKEREGKYSITIPGSKSESNRLLVLQSLYANLTINNLSNSDDTQSLINGLKVINGIVDVHHAGTAMRFLTAYYASIEGSRITLTGSRRMKERPIKILVDALRDLGAEITYLKNEGYPPLKIVGKKLNNSSVKISSEVSSQYITALMLVAPSLSNGLNIELNGDITSIPYIEMTLEMLQKIGVTCSFSNNKIVVKPIKKINDITVKVESDWSSASYFYSIVALSENMEINLESFNKNSFQGDSELSEIYKSLGIETVFNTLENTITLNNNNKNIKPLNLNLNNTPDIAQTIAVTCFGLGIACKLTGLKTLKIKETDRLLALKTELEKLGAKIKITNESIEVFSSSEIKNNILINTYQDHRMAMAFAPLSLLTSIEIDEPNVVSKSYPTFWNDLKKTGITVQIK